MSGAVEKLTELKHLATMTMRARQARMNALQAQINDLIHKMDQLTQKTGEMAPVDPAQPATRAGAMILWRRWVEARQIAINQQISLLAADLEVERELFRKEFGRAQAIDDLLEVRGKEARKKAARPRF